MLISISIISTKVNVGKTKSIVSASGNNTHNLELNGCLIEKQESFKYLENIFEENG